MFIDKETFKKHFKKTDYNDAIINAIGGMFQYSHLLWDAPKTEDIIDEWDGTTPIYHDVVDTNCVIFKFIDYFRACNKSGESATSWDADDFCGEDLDLQDSHNVLWQLLVLMFGDYGTSPRAGWIAAEFCAEAADFLEYIVAYTGRCYNDNLADQR